MPRSLPTRLAALLLLTAALQAQSRNPSRPAPASRPGTTPTTVPDTPPIPLTPAQSPPKRATISYTDGQLTISASNSSLNQVLREVSRLTGIQITGGVAEERVFGDYGPAQPIDVLNTLLDGTASNVLFVASVGDKAPELILTPRTGGATPPNPNASRFDDNADNDDEPRQVAAPAPQPSGSQSQPARPNPVATPIAPAAQNSDANMASPATSPAATDSNQQQSPNGTKTPQQIYDELMRLRRQQQSQPE